MAPETGAWPLSDGEIHFLWWFIQGSIMEPDIRQRLRRAWGFCERHGWGALAVETAFRHGYLHGPALLYQDLMERALGALERAGPWLAPRLVRKLRPTSPCLMCEMDLRRRGGGAAREELFEQGRDAQPLRAFADMTQPYWRSTVCGRCLGDGSTPRCRPHLREDARGRRVADLAAQRELAGYITTHVTAYARSFRWERRDTETNEDRAALIGAVGWCSGWQAWLPLLGLGMVHGGEGASVAEGSGEPCASR